MLRPNALPVLGLFGVSALSAACSASTSVGNVRASDGQRADEGTKRTAFPAPPPAPPRAEVRDVQTRVDGAPLTVTRSEPLGTLQGPQVRVQLARGNDGTWAALASNGRSAAPVFWLPPGAKSFSSARGHEGILLSGELGLLLRTSNAGETQVASAGDELRPLAGTGWGPPRSLTPAQAEAARVAGTSLPVDWRASFTLASAGAQHGFRWEGNHLVWSLGEETRTLCECDGVFRALVDPEDAAPTLFVAEESGAFVYRFAAGAWTRATLVPRSLPAPDPSVCEVGSATSGGLAALPPACSSVTHRVLALDATRYAGATRALWVDERREVQLQCLRQRYPCDPAGPRDTCPTASVSWSCTPVTSARAASLMQATLTHGVVGVAPVDGVLPAEHEEVSLALQADDAALHLVAASGRGDRPLASIHHLELGPPGTARRDARPVLAVPAPTGALGSEEDLLASGFSGFGEGVFDGGTLELRKSAHRATSPTGSFQFEVEGRFGSQSGHGIELSGSLGSVVLRVDAARATLEQNDGRTEPVGPLVRTSALATRELDASRAHRYAFVVTGDSVEVSVDGRVLGVGHVRGGASSLRFGCIGDCDAPSLSSVWRALKLTQR